MKYDLIAIAIYLVIIVAVLGVSALIFNAVINSNLPLFWKYIILK